MDVHKLELRRRDPQSVSPRLPVSASPGMFVEMQVPGPHFACRVPLSGRGPGKLHLIPAPR